MTKNTFILMSDEEIEKLQDELKSKQDEFRKEKALDDFSLFTTESVYPQVLCLRDGEQVTSTGWDTVTYGVKCSVKGCKMDGKMCEDLDYGKCKEDIEMFHFEKKDEDHK